MSARIPRKGKNHTSSTVDAEALAPALADDAVHVSVRGDAIRVSVHAFNNDADVDHLLEALGRRLGRRP